MQLGAQVAELGLDAVEVADDAVVAEDPVVEDERVGVLPASARPTDA